MPRTRRCPRRPPGPASSIRTRRPAMRAEPVAPGGASIPAPRETAPDGPRITLLPTHASTRAERGPRAGWHGARVVFVAVGALPGAVGFNLLLNAPTRDVGGYGTAGWYTLASGTLTA